MTEPVKQVGRPRRHLRGVPEPRPQVQLLRYRRAAPVATAGERPVQRHDQRLRAARPRPAGTFKQRVAIRGPVHLEEDVRVHRGHVRHRLASELAEPHRGPRVAGAQRDGHLAERVHRLRADRRGDHRQADVHPQNRGAQLTAGRQVGKTRRSEPDLAERAHVGGSGDARLRPRLKGEEYRPGQPPPRPPPRLGHGLEPVARASHR